jgi:hypothetical protein
VVVEVVLQVVHPNLHRHLEIDMRHSHHQHQVLEHVLGMCMNANHSLAILSSFHRMLSCNFDVLHGNGAGTGFALPKLKLIPILSGDKKYNP